LVEDTTWLIFGDQAEIVSIIGRIHDLRASNSDIVSYPLSQINISIPTKD